MYNTILYIELKKNTVTHTQTYIYDTMLHLQHYTDIILVYDSLYDIIIHPSIQIVCIVLNEEAKKELRARRELCVLLTNSQLHKAPSFIQPHL